jgi:hypothetical protein
MPGATRRFSSRPPDGVDSLFKMDMEEFATDLNIARNMWQKYPELVENSNVPENLRAVLEDALETASGAVSLTDPLEPGHRESMRPDAIEIAQNSARKRRHLPDSAPTC